MIDNEAASARPRNEPERTSSRRRRGGEMKLERRDQGG